MARNGDMSAASGALLDFAQKWLLPIVIAFCSWQYTEISKLEDRVNVLQSTSVTQTQLQLSESKTMALFDLRVNNVEQKITSVAEKQELTNEYLKTLIEMSKQKTRP